MRTALTGVARGSVVLAVAAGLAGCAAGAPTPGSRIRNLLDEAVKVYLEGEDSRLGYEVAAGSEHFAVLRACQELTVAVEYADGGAIIDRVAVELCPGSTLTVTAAGSVEHES